MTVKKHELELDFINGNKMSPIEVRVGELATTHLNVAVTNRNETCDINGWKIFFECKRANGSKIRDGRVEHFQIIDARKGKFLYKPCRELSTVSGSVTLSYFALEKYDEKGVLVNRITTKNFGMTVVTDVFEDKGLGDTFYTDIYELNEKVSEVKNNAEEVLNSAIENSNNILRNLQQKSNEELDRIEDEGDIILNNLEVESDRVVKEIKDEHKILKEDYLNATHTQIFEKSDGKIIIKNDKTEEFELQLGQFNPLIDILFLYYKGIKLIPGENYDLTGMTVRLLDWYVNKNDVISYRIEKAVKEIRVPGEDGSRLMDGSVSKEKLTDDLKQSINDTQNKTFFINSSDFVKNSEGFYEYVLKHDLNSKNLITETYTSSGKEIICCKTILDFNNIKIENDEQVDMKINCSVSYYGYQGNVKDLSMFSTADLPENDNRLFMTPKDKQLITETSIQLEHMGNELDKNTTQLEQTCTKTKSINNYFLTTDSIGGAGNFNTKLATMLGVTGTDSVKGGQLIACGLSNFVDKILVEQVEENRLIYSNSLGQSAWTKSGNLTLKQGDIIDGKVWNKITVNSQTTGDMITQYNPGSGQDSSYKLTYPSNATGIYFSLETFSEVSGNFYGLAIFVNNKTKGGNKQIILKGSTPIKGHNKFIMWVDKADLTWTEGDIISVDVVINKNVTVSGTCEVWLRNLQLCFNSINGYTNYVETNGYNAVIPTSLDGTLKEINLYRNNIDLTVIQFGRNDSGYKINSSTFTGVTKNSFFKSLDKLVYNAKKYSNYVIPLNPPPLSDKSNSWLADASDNYTKNYLNMFKSMMFRWNIGIDVQTEMKKLVSDGKYTVSQLQSTDGVHQTDTGSDVIVSLIKSDLDKPVKVVNNFIPLLDGNIIYYPLGKRTGTWKIKTSSGIDTNSNLIGGGNSSLYAESSTLGDIIEFNNIECEQLHILFFDDTNIGTFDVFIDYGKNNQVWLQGFTGDGVSKECGKFLIDFNKKGVHNVKIQITSTDKPVKIRGIVAI